MLKNTTLLVAACLIAGSPLLAQDKKVAPAPVVHQKEVTAADVKKKPVVIKNEEVRSPAAKQVKFTPPVVKKDVASSAGPKSKMVKFTPPKVVKDEEQKVDEVKLPPPPPPAPPKKKS